MDVFSSSNCGILPQRRESYFSRKKEKQQGVNSRPVAGDAIRLTAMDAVSHDQAVDWLRSKLLNQEGSIGIGLGTTLINIQGDS